jgi:chromate transporter
MAKGNRNVPSTVELFISFLIVGVSGFGGVLPMTHRMIVHERAWLSEEEFVDVLSLCHFLPGPNIVNLTIVVGRRFQGVRGAIAATLGVVLLPLVIVVLLAKAVEGVEDSRHLQAGLAAMAAAATGLILAVGLKMARSLRAGPWQPVIALMVLLCVAILRLPLLWVVLFAAPSSIFLALRFRPR